MAKVKKTKSIEKGLYAAVAFKCNGVKKSKMEKISQDELKKMMGDKKKIKCDHLLHEVE